MNNESDTWRNLLLKINEMTEEELLAALNYEVITKNRKSVTLRLHQRYTKIRMLRERDSLHKGELL